MKLTTTVDANYVIRLVINIIYLNVLNREKSTGTLSERRHDCTENREKHQELGNKMHCIENSPWTSELPDARAPIYTGCQYFRIEAADVVQ